jgi:hypothetical protein
MTAAARMRTYRSRRKGGIEVLPVPANVVDLTETLIAGGFLARSKADDRAALIEATAKFLEAATVADVYPRDA